MRRTRSYIVVVAAILCFAVQADACWLVPRVYQVTRLKGTVVGKPLGHFQFRWFQRMFKVPGAELEVYEDSQPTLSYDKPLARTVANAGAEFEFGALKEGRYALHVSGGGMDDWFAIEITNKVPVTQHMTIDISPLLSDCSGGHYVNVEAEKK